MEKINSFDELCDYIIALDEKEQLFPDISGIGKLIDEILTQKEIEKQTPNSSSWKLNINIEGENNVIKY